MNLFQTIFLILFVAIFAFIAFRCILSIIKSVNEIRLNFKKNNSLSVDKEKEVKR